MSQVGENCLEGAQVPVNIRYDCDSHFARRLYDSGLDAAHQDIGQTIFPLPCDKFKETRNRTEAAQETAQGLKSIRQCPAMRLTVHEDGLVWAMPVN